MFPSLPISALIDEIEPIANRSPRFLALGNWYARGVDLGPSCFSQCGSGCSGGRSRIGCWFLDRLSRNRVGDTDPTRTGYQLESEEPDNLSVLISEDATLRPILLSCARSTVLLLLSPINRMTLQRPLTKDSGREKFSEGAAWIDDLVVFSAAPHAPQNLILGSYSIRALR